MHRRIFIRNTAVLSAGLLLSRSALASFFRLAEPRITLIRKNVGYFTERGGTIGFAHTNEGIVVIDSQFPDTAAHFIEEARKLGDKPFAYLLNTHHHGDHSGGNIAFRGLVKQVMAHENSLANQKAVAEKGNNLDKVLLPNLTFQDEAKLKTGKEKIGGYYLGVAHTNGDAVWHFEDANVAHLGDLMFNRRHPVVDRSAGASMKNWIEVLEKTKKKFSRDTIYIFGHSLDPHPVTGSAEDLTKFQDYLQKVLRFTESEIRAGKSKEEFLKTTTLPFATEWSGAGLERPLGAAYDELSAAKA